MRLPCLVDPQHEPVRAGNSSRDESDAVTGQNPVVQVVNDGIDENPFDFIERQIELTGYFPSQTAFGGDVDFGRRCLATLSANRVQDAEHPDGAG